MVNNYSTDNHAAASRSRKPLLRAAAVAGLFLAFTMGPLAALAQGEPGSAEWKALGETTYANCAACHQADGSGLPPVFPPLAGHAADLAALPGGTNYLMHTVLFGLEGEIMIGDATFNGVMPAWGHLSDAEIAAVIDYIIATWPSEDAEAAAEFEPLTADDVAAARATPLTPDEVHALRAMVVTQ
jgi:mono/diheme cytochrome c family protein